ncbi:MAG: GNAT family N-acetyltransferase [Lachnospiraceae bacterium]|nr:GNAT family N-acetyltransferase [Lachnospiraceae bacterium]
MGFDVRWAKREEWADAVDLVWRTFQRFNRPDCTAGGAESFRRFVMSKDLRDAFLEGSYQMMVAHDGERVIGVGSLRGQHHLSLLYVDEAYHHQGVGRALIEALCDYLQAEMGEHCMTLTASPYAKEFYKKLGFVETEAGYSLPGLPVTFMEKVF